MRVVLLRKAKLVQKNENENENGNDGVQQTRHVRFDLPLFIRDRKKRKTKNENRSLKVVRSFQ